MLTAFYEHSVFHSLYLSSVWLLKCPWCVDDAMKLRSIAVAHCQRRKCNCIQATVPSSYVERCSTWQRHLYREDTALLSSWLHKKSDLLGEAGQAVHCCARLCKGVCCARRSLSELAFAAQRLGVDVVIVWVCNVGNVSIYQISHAANLHISYLGLAWT